MCNQPIFGLVSDELYLSPHYGQFGITYKKSFNQLQVESIVADSIASIHGIREDWKVAWWVVWEHAT
jgi:hypothetical protein